MKCSRCKETKEIYNKRRQLCHACYGKEYRDGKIPPLRSVRNRLVRLYGHGIIDDFEQATHDPTVTLIGIAKRYGVSRQYIHLLFKSMYKKPYREYLNEKIKERNRIIPSKTWLKSDQSSYKSNRTRPVFIKICQERGYIIEYSLNLHHYHIKTNGIKTVIRSGGVPHKTNTQCQHTYHVVELSKNHVETAGILAFFHPTLSKFFIIPIKICPKRVYIPTEKPLNPNKYWENHLDAWRFFEKR